MSNICLLVSGTQGNHELQGAHGCGGDCTKGFVCLMDIAMDVQDSQEYLNGFCIENFVDICMDGMDGFWNFVQFSMYIGGDFKSQGKSKEFLIMEITK